MYGTALKKMMSERGLKSANGVIYGVIGGYMCTFDEGVGYKRMSVSCAVTDEAYAKLSQSLQIKMLSKQFRVANVNIERESVTIIFTDTIGTMKKIEAFIDWFQPVFRQSGALGDGFCTSCGEMLSATDESNVLLINGIAHRVHAACSGGLAERAENEKIAYEDEDKHIGKGAVGAFLGGIVGALPWAIAYSFGWFFGIIGLLIGFCSKKGYELAGGRPCKSKMWIILVFTLLASIAGQFLGTLASFAVELSKTVDAAVTYADLPSLIIYLLRTDSEFAGGFIKDLALGVFFAVLGVLSVLRDAREEHKNAALTTAVLE